VLLCEVEDEEEEEEEDEEEEKVMEMGENKKGKIVFAERKGEAKWELCKVEAWGSEREEKKS